MEAVGYSCKQRSLVWCRKLFVCSNRWAPCSNYSWITLYYNYRRLLLHPKGVSRFLKNQRIVKTNGHCRAYSLQLQTVTHSGQHLQKTYSDAVNRISENATETAWGWFKDILWPKLNVVTRHFTGLLCHIWKFHDPWWLLITVAVRNELKRLFFFFLKSHYISLTYSANQCDVNSIKDLRGQKRAQLNVVPAKMLIYLFIY